MTVEELKVALLGKEYTTPIRLGDHAVITDDAQLFLRTSFQECDRWSKDIEKCPAYGRLLKFYEVTRISSS